MNARLVYELIPGKNNPRNSEGSFIRAKNGDILFAYSRYSGDSAHDHAACDIVMIRSHDEGESWGESCVIARASDFGVKNLMSVSALYQKNGDIAFYFMIKENDFTTTVGRTVSTDGESFTSMRCKADFAPNYHVLNNDRVIRTKEGRLLAPVAYISADECRDRSANGNPHSFKTTLLYSDDDGESFKRVDWSFNTDAYRESERDLQEPGIIERQDGSLFLFMRTNLGSQFESVSTDGINGFSKPCPGRFTSPLSPMQIKWFDGEYFAVYNPIPNYNGRPDPYGTWGRTPLVIRKGSDFESFGKLNIIEDDEKRGYCYPAIFKTNDGHLLVGYCRGAREDGGFLCRLGISKIELSGIE